MEKINKALTCPYCKGEHGNNINCKLEDKIEKEENEHRSIITIKRDYKCYCDDCKKEYTVDYGSARLIRYYPFITSTNDDVKLYVEYESEFDRSYQITEVKGTPMIIVEDDPEPIIITANTKEELIDDHDKAKSFNYHTFMNRNR